MGQLEQIERRANVDLQPVYNIKAVVEATGLPAATLRAWERRYGALSPSRNGKGYRLYSAHDILLLHWLKQRVEEGLSISQAFALIGQYGQSEVPGSAEPAPVLDHGVVRARHALLHALVGFDETAADRTIAEAYALYGPEAVGEQLIASAMVQIGEQWHRGKVSTATEHFASNYLRRKLDAVINASPRQETGPLIVLGCAPDDWHELGLLMLYLVLRRRSYNVLYLGQSVPVAQFADEMQRLRPALIAMSAATEETVPGLIELAQSVQRIETSRLIFGFGGSIFNSRPELREAVPGVFLGENTRTATEKIAQLLGSPGVPVLRPHSVVDS